LVHADVTIVRPGKNVDPFLALPFGSIKAALENAAFSPNQANAASLEISLLKLAKRECLLQGDS
jgi:hypothetical protein